MKATHRIVGTALICLSGCANCGDEPGNTNNDNNGGTPEECTPEFQFASDDWDVKEDRHLIAACSPYIVDDSVEVTEGARLTIDPGVTMLFGNGWLRVRAGSIVANGTEEEPIVFTTSENTPAPGSWLGFRFGSEIEAGNEISHAVIEYGGAEQFTQEGCITIDPNVQPGTISLTDVEFRSCAQSGLAAKSVPFKELGGLSFIDNADYGLRINSDSVGDITEAFTYENTPANYIFGDEVTVDATWVAQGVPYHVQDSIDVRGDSGPILTLGAGLVLQFENDHWLRVGEGNGGGIVAQGTATEPVIFESAQATKAAGDWLGLRFGDSLSAESALDYAIVRHAGQDAFSQFGCVTINTATSNRLSVSNSTFEDCQQTGVAATREEFSFASFVDNAFVNSDSGITVRPNAVGSIAGGQTFEGVDYNFIDGGDVTDTATWVAQDVPWRVTDSIDVGSDGGPELTIEGGTYQFQSDHWLRAGSSPATLKIMGTSDAPVVLESAQATKAAGDWLGVRIGAQISTGTVIENARISHGGQDSFSTAGAVTIDGDGKGRVSIHDTELTDCLQACIAATQRTFEFGEVSGVTFRNSDAGFSVSPAAIPQIMDTATYDGTDHNLLKQGDVEDDGTWVKQDMPWNVVGSIDVGGDNGPTLTIEAGNVFRFAADQWLRVGSSPGTLKIMGTSSDPVTFTSRQASGAAGDWLGLRLENQTGNGTLIDNVVLEYAGQDSFSTRGGITMNDTGSAITISNSTFRDNLQTDIWVDTGSTPTLTNNTGTVTNE